ncbi:MAG: hypothetical protein JW811_10200 [Clostridiales bacterium]|nr:hypothetical protein [Clostridiales bacterium]
MSFHMPISKRRISHHFQYSVWMYLVLTGLALFGWNLLYTTTRYQPPEDLRVEFYAQAPAGNETLFNTLADRIHAEIMPEMELVTASPVTITDDYYGDMQMTVWISAAQGDIYLINQEYFARFASAAAFLELQPYIDSGGLDTDGLDLSAGYATLTDPDPGFEGRRLYGIPADQLTGFYGYSADPAGMVLCVLYRNGNDEYSIKFLNYLLENLR